MTDEEFQSVLNQVQREEEDAERMAEGLDLASQAGGSVNPEESTVEPEVPVVTSEVAKPTGPKTKSIRRKLELKDDPKAKRPKPSHVSQRCLGRWAAKGAGSNTASEAVEVSRDEEGEAPADDGEKTPPMTDEEAQVDEQGEVSPTRTAQEETPAETEPIQTQETMTLDQEEPSSQRNPDREEEWYQLERKQKGKAPAQKKQPAKKARTAEQGIVFREQPREELSDGDYSASEESESEDESLEDETMDEQQLPSNHWELVQPPMERMEYQPWPVKLDDGLMEAMKRLDNERMQDAFDGKDDNSKLIKSG